MVLAAGKGNAAASFVKVKVKGENTRTPVQEAEHGAWSRGSQR